MADFDPRTPSVARVYDYLLDGKDNFAADREVAQRLLGVVDAREWRPDWEQAVHLRPVTAR